MKKCLYPPVSDLPYAPRVNKMFRKLKILYHEFLGCIITLTGNREYSSNHFLEAAKLGSPRSQNIIAAFYYEGRGLVQDNQKAFHWYNEAAKQGHLLGMANMGWVYYNAIGVPQNYSKSLIWYKKAADKGHPESQYTLGYMYAIGLGVNKDLQQAISWLTKAKRNKYKKAGELLDEINT